MVTRKVLLKAIFVLSFFSAFSQEGNTVSLHSAGKIYVVIGVLVLIFCGIIAFLIYLERKLNRIEKQLKDNG